MSTVRLRRVTSIAITATAALALSACGTSFSAQTNQQYEAAVGSDLRDGKLLVLNALFVDNADETATFSAALINKGEDAQTLTGVTATTTDGKPIEADFAEPLELAPQKLHNPGTEGDIILTGAFPAGGFVKLTFEFEEAESISITAPVVTRNEIYEDVAEESSAAAEVREQAAVQQEQQESAKEDPGAE